MLVFIVSGIFGVLAGVCIYESYIESILFDKEQDLIILKRTHMISMQEKVTYHRMSQVVRVYAALRGIKKGNNDMTSYNLILKLGNGQTLKICETKNASKIRRELICLRKFLDLEDDVIAIYDETRKKNYEKHENRLVGMPDEGKKVDS